MIQDNSKEYAGIIKAVEYYIEGARTNDRETLWKAFSKTATMSWRDENGKLKTVPIEELFEYGISVGNQSVSYEMAVISATEDAAIVRIESSFSVAGNYTDMFALVKEEEDWKIIAKIYHKKIELL